MMSPVLSVTGRVLQKAVDNSQGPLKRKAMATSSFLASALRQWTVPSPLYFRPSSNSVYLSQLSGLGAPVEKEEEEKEEEDFA